MLSAEAARLAAIEALSPTRANQGGGPFPTLAGARIFDSRSAALNELDDRSEWDGYTPVVAVYSRQSRADTRGEAAEFDDTDASIEIEFVAELAVVAEDEGVPFVDALAGDDPEARLVLAALCGQIRRILLFAPEGDLFRHMIRGVRRIDWEPFAVPELGLRFQRTTMRLTCMARDDVFSDEAGLPEPLRTLAARLPADSYARSRLDQLGAHFSAIGRTPLKDIRLAPEADGEFVSSTGDIR